MSDFTKKLARRMRPSLGDGAKVEDQQLRFTGDDVTESDSSFTASNVVPDADLCVNRVEFKWRDGDDVGEGEGVLANFRLFEAKNGDAKGSDDVADLPTERERVGLLRGLERRRQGKFSRSRISQEIQSVSDIRNGLYQLFGHTLDPAPERSTSYSLTREQPTTALTHRGETTSPDISTDGDVAQQSSFTYTTPPNAAVLSSHAPTPPDTLRTGVVSHVNTSNDTNPPKTTAYSLKRQQPTTAPAHSVEITSPDIPTGDDVAQKSCITYTIPPNAAVLSSHAPTPPDTLRAGVVAHVNTSNDTNPPKTTATSAHPPTRTGNHQHLPVELRIQQLRAQVESLDNDDESLESALIQLLALSPNYPFALQKIVALYTRQGDYVLVKHYQQRLKLSTLF